MTHEKECLKCGIKFPKPEKYSSSQWQRRKFCSKVCQSIDQKGKPAVGGSWKKGVKFAVPRACEICGHISERTTFYKKFKKLLCGRHFAQMSRHGEVLWVGEWPKKTPLAKSLRRSQKYFAWRKAVFERDNYTCVWCGVRGGELAPDHITPFSLLLRASNARNIEEAFNYERLWDVENGRTLCRDCHLKTPTFGRSIRKEELSSYLTTLS